MNFDPRCPVLQLALEAFGGELGGPRCFAPAGCKVQKKCFLFYVAYGEL